LNIKSKMTFFEISFELKGTRIFKLKIIKKYLNLIKIRNRGDLARGPFKN
jgi:hypothetical protein